MSAVIPSSIPRKSIIAAFTPSEKWAAPSKVGRQCPHALLASQQEQSLLAWEAASETGGPCIAALPELNCCSLVQNHYHCTLCLSNLENKVCRAQMYLVLKRLGCPPKAGDPLQHGAKALVQALRLNPWPAPPAWSCPLTLHKQTITYNVRENNLTHNHWLEMFAYGWIFIACKR